ncbi:Mucin-associated surface protein (MASP) subgroup S002 [Trypanosoma cruzi]|uniref:Mucin-associated surface protein (MASP) subgroup S002 n=1 Tax=Trypanosoma cruzi TaxID=5693 RepID=A0A7J6XNC5_TRYCR|nr:Mucin-associated surface protein (MASP) subgroup S002 [Trypanosoma cruzi]
MAMMMTGRVLLVCALCVLWCGAGSRCDEGEAAGRVSGAELLPGSKPLVTPRVGSQGLQNGVTVVKEEVSPISSLPQDGNAGGDEGGEGDDGGDDDDKETEAEEESIEGRGGKGGTVAIGSDSREENLIGSENEKNQSIASAGGILPSGSQESNANPTQPEVEGKKEPDENTPAVEDALATGNGENTLPRGGNLPSPPEDGVASREQDGEDTTSEGKKNVQSPDTAATPQSHREEGSEGTAKDTNATTVNANTTNTTSTQNSDSSTAVSHTTSPLLLLLVVACAAAAAVVAA